MTDTALKNIVALTLLSFSWIGGTAKSEEKANIQPSIVQFGNYVLKHWRNDQKLNKFNPPQIITNISSSTQVLGGCVSAVAGKISRDVGGTSYCPASNTIYVVPEQIIPLFTYFGPASTAYVLAHEYGHYIQAALEIPSKPILSELQADCLAGNILGQGYKELEITPDDIVNMAMTAYSIGDPEHGTGAQRAYAVYAGFGYSKEISCSMEDMKKLSRNKISDPTFHELSKQRSAGKRNEYGSQKYLKGISGSLGI